MHFHAPSLPLAAHKLLIVFTVNWSYSITAAHDFVTTMVLDGVTVRDLLLCVIYAAIYTMVLTTTSNTLEVG